MGFVIFLSILLFVVWGIVLVRKTHLAGGCMAVLIAGCCFGHAFFHVSLGPLPLTIDRVLLVVLLVLYVFYRWRGATQLVPLGLSDLLLLSLIIVTAASLVAHDWHTDGAKPLARWISFYLMPLALYWIARECRWTPRAVESVFVVLTLLGGYFAVTALAEQQQMTSLVFPRYIASPELPEFYGRARGALLNPIGTGIFMIVGACALLLAWPRLNKIGRSLVFVVMGLFAVGIACTLTRSVWLSAALAGLTGLLMLTPRHLKAPALITAACTFLMVLGAAWNDFAAFKRDEFVSVEDMAKSAQLRPILATVAWEMFRDKPLFGCGFGQYSSQHIHYLSSPSARLPLEIARPYVQHNVVLSLLTETGLLGGGLLLLLLLAWTREALSLYTAAAAPLWARQTALLILVTLTVYLVNGLFHDVSIIAMVHMLLFLLAGMLRGVQTVATTAAYNVTAQPEI